MWVGVGGGGGGGGEKLSVCKSCFHLQNDGRVFQVYSFILTLSAPNFSLRLSSFFFLINYRLERSLYVKLKD